MKRPALLLSLVVLASCSSSAAPPTTTSSTPSTSIVATTTPSTTTTTTTTTTVPSTTTTPPRTTTTAPLETTFQSILDRYDSAVNAILADPRVANEPNDPNVKAYLALFQKDATFPAGVVTYWAEEGAKGRFYKPGPAGVLQRSRLLKVTTTTATEARFTMCAYQSMTVVDANGGQLEGIGGVAPVDVVALNIDGVWLLRDLTKRAGDECPKVPAT
jgi:hypothetical protein